MYIKSGELSYALPNDTCKEQTTPVRPQAITSSNLPLFFAWHSYAVWVNNFRIYLPLPLPLPVKVWEAVCPLPLKAVWPLPTTWAPPPPPPPLFVFTVKKKNLTTVYVLPGLQPICLSIYLPLRVFINWWPWSWMDVCCTLGETYRPCRYVKNNHRVRFFLKPPLGWKFNQSKIGFLPGYPGRFCRECQEFCNSIGQ